MQEPPEITIVDPAHPHEVGDVLLAGSERPPLRLPRKVLVLGATVALLVGGTAVGVDRYQQHQDELRRKAAAFAIADTVHVQLTAQPDGVFALDPATSYETQSPDGSSVAERRPPPDTGTLTVPVVLTDDASGVDVIDGLALEDSDLGVTFDSTAFDARTPGEPSLVDIALTLPCGPVAAGHIPRLGTLVVLVRPQSGRRHRLRLALTSPQSPRALALTACDLIDPTAVPTAGAEAQHGELLVVVEGVPRSTAVLHVLAFRSPGLDLRLAGGEHAIPPGTGAYLPVSVRVTDCAAARTGNGVVTVIMRADAKTYTVVATDNALTSYRRPGSVFLKELVAKRC